MLVSPMMCSAARRPINWSPLSAGDYRLSGHLNLLHFFRYVIAKGWMPASSALYQICHGVELVSTNGKPERFAVNGFSVTMKPRR